MRKLILASLTLVVLVGLSTPVEARGLFDLCRFVACRMWDEGERPEWCNNWILPDSDGDEVSVMLDSEGEYVLPDLEHDWNKGGDPDGYGLDE